MAENIRKYNTLVISNSSVFNKEMTILLDNINNYSIVNTLTDKGTDYDFVIINTLNFNIDEILLYIDKLLSLPCAIMLICGLEVSKPLERQLIKKGIIIMKKPISKSSLKQALSFLPSYYEKVSGFNKQIRSLELKLKNLQVINRAKLLLITKENMSEDAAHKFLEKEAMNNCISLKDMANKIINNYT